MKKLTVFSVRQADRYLCFYHSNYDFHMVIANLMYSLDQLVSLIPKDWAMLALNDGYTPF